MVGKKRGSLILTWCRRFRPSDKTSKQGLTSCVVFLVTCGLLWGQEKPNVLLILTDDLAWSDLGCYGHPWHHTPHIDRLASRGLLYTDAYAPAPICSASRASILTGKTTARLHFEFVTKDKPGHQQIDSATPLRAPPFTLNLPLEEETIAEKLAAAGYDTAYFGKWHLNAHYQAYLGWSPTHGPGRQGFSFAKEDFGSHPYSWGASPPDKMMTVGQFPADSMIDKVGDFIHGRHPHPFFMMVAQFYVHTPVNTPCQWLLDKYSVLVPNESPNRNERVRYAAFVETLDHYVGRILEALEQSGQQENTLVLLTSDNGGHPEYTANAPLRGSKWNLYEGGIRVPLIASWPKVISPGEKCRTPVIGYDFLPTLESVAGAPVSDVDGISIAATFEDPEWQVDRSLIWHFPYYHPEKGFAAAPEGIGVDDFVVSRTRPQSAIRRGPHKLITFYENQASELYELENDISEQIDLSQQRPELTTQLSSELSRRLDAMQARFPTRTQ